MKQIYLFTFLIAIVLAGCTETPSGETLVETETVEATPAASDGLFIHVSSGYDNPKKAMMAITLANKVIGIKDVTLFFDIEGVRLLTKNSKDIDLGGYMSLHAALDSLVAANVQIMACPMCMKAAGIDESMLRDGVTTATVDGFFNFTDGRILTLDY
ncbi:DsrE family protein [Bacteroidota bacterium]